MPCNGVPRCYEPVTDEHLQRLTQTTLPVFEHLFDRRPASAGRYKGRLIMLALCQGAALHRINGQHGVKDLDVWGFFRTHPGGPFPVRSRWSRDFGLSSLGYHPDDTGYAGRRVDILGRSIDAPDGEDVLISVRRYLTAKPTKTAWHLAQRPVIALHPTPFFGTQVWPVTP